MSDEKSEGWDGSEAPDPPEVIVVPVLWLRSRSGLLLAVALVAGVQGLLFFFSPIAGIPTALVAIFVLSRLAGWCWSDLGFRRPLNWVRLLSLAFVVAAALQLFAWLVILPLLERFGIPRPDLSAFAGIEGNLPTLLVFLAVSWTTAGFGEEIVWRGFLLPRLAQVLGGGRSAELVSLLLTSVAFGLLHAYQGVTGIVLTGFAGLMLGALFLVARRRLWLVILAHGFMDTIAFVLLFFGWIDFG